MYFQDWYLNLVYTANSSYHFSNMWEISLEKVETVKIVPTLKRYNETGAHVPIQFCI